MRLIDADALIERLLYCFYEEEKVSISSVTGTFLTEFCSPTIEVEPVRIDGNTSDGYHTFNELYHHRAVLFSVIVKAFPQKAWKSRKHHDGTMFDGMFIVGIETPDGQATYHYDLEPYWDMFNCTELEFAPEWDGHTANQAIERIGKLEPVRHGKWLMITDSKHCGVCSVCFRQDYIDPLATHCRYCGAKMDLEGE